MNERELKIFNQGVEVGMKLEKEFAQTFKLLVTDTAKTILKRKSRGKGKAWTEYEDDMLKINNNWKVNELMKLLPDRTKCAIVARRVVIGVKKDKKVETNLANLGQ